MIPNGIDYSTLLTGKSIRSILLLSTLLMATGATAFSLTDNSLASSLNPARLFALGKISPGLFTEMFGQSNVNVLVETRTDQYSSVITNIARLGGQVTMTYKHVTGLAATLPGAAVFELAQNPEVVSIDPDAIVTASSGFHGIESAREREHLANSFLPINEQFTAVDWNIEAVNSKEPNTFINVVTHGAVPLISQGITGRDTIAAIIDTGIYSGHFMIGRPKVVGGVDLSSDVGTGFEGFDDIRNHWHGSAVAGVMGGFARILVSSTSLLAQSIELHSGSTLPAGPVPGTKIITLSGIAPATRFFVIKVFPHSGAGASTSTIVRGIDAAIDAKTTGQFEIDIISMSLGGATLFDGRGIDAQAIQNAVAAGISVSIAAGNEGPAPMTVADPGASHVAITSAAAVHPINTRVSWDLFFGQLGIGSDLFVSNTPQIHAFSNRGPTADGRAKPDVSSIGVDTLSAFPCATNTAEGCSPNRGQGLAFVSGTSFATPATSGVLSLLNDYVERVLGMPDGATPEDLKQAVIDGADPIPGFSSEEQGSGFVNAANSKALLNPATFGTTAPPLAPIPQGTPLTATADIRNTFLASSPTDPVRTFTESITLNPGQNREYVFETVKGTSSIEVTLSNVNAGANPNPNVQASFPNGFEVYIHDSKRGGSDFGYYIYSANVEADASFTINEASTTFTGPVRVFPEDVVSSVIEPGFSKVVIEGDWTNAVQASADITIEVTFATPPTPDMTLTGTVSQFNFGTGAGLVVRGPFNLNRGSVLKLYWTPGDYAHFPTSDVDVILGKGPNISPGDNFQGATLDSPERTVALDSGTFFVLIMGFEINPASATETWTLEIFL
jgi:hypothetical protein